MVRRSTAEENVLQRHTCGLHQARCLNANQSNPINMLLACGALQLIEAPTWHLASMTQQSEACGNANWICCPGRRPEEAIGLHKSRVNQVSRHSQQCELSARLATSVPASNTDPKQTNCELRSFDEHAGCRTTKYGENSDLGACHAHQVDPKIRLPCSTGFIMFVTRGKEDVM